MPTGHRIAAVLSVALLCLVVRPVSLWSQEVSPADDSIDRPAVRILPPVGAVSGPTKIEVLVINRDVARLEATVDGEPAGTRKRPPWDVKVALDAPAREQTVGVTAYDDAGKTLGAHALIVNRVDPPLRLRIASLAPAPDGHNVTVTTEVSVPRKATLREVRFFLNENLIATREQPPFEAAIPRPETIAAEDFVRVIAELADGRTVEDVELLFSRGVSDEVEVNLVQIQTLVTTRNGVPQRDLVADDFEIRQRGKPQTVDRVYDARDIALVLGVVVDASGSMGPMWNTTINAASNFLDQALAPRDRAFVIDFDTQLRLTQALTNDRQALDSALESVAPEGGTALFDAILYGLLQYADEPGRRALVVITDGLDYGSTADADRTIDIARRLGVPVYIVALPHRGGGSEATNVVHSLKLLTDPSGGRLLRLRGNDGLARAFAQIADELRSQYIVAYYTDARPDNGQREVEVRIKNRKDLEVRAVLPLDLVTKTDAVQSPSQSKK